MALGATVRQPAGIGGKINHGLARPRQAFAVIVLTDAKDCHSLCLIELEDVAQNIGNPMIPIEAQQPGVVTCRAALMGVADKVHKPGESEEDE